MKVFLSSTRITGSPSDSYVSIKLPWTRVPSALQTASLAASCCCAVAIMSATQARYIFPAKYRFRLIQQKLHQNRDVSRHRHRPRPVSRLACRDVQRIQLYSDTSIQRIHYTSPYTIPLVANERELPAVPYGCGKEELAGRGHNRRALGRRAWHKTWRRHGVEIWLRALLE